MSAPRANAPRISVVIPSRDCLAYLPDAIASIRAQEGGEIAPGSIEVVVVDDGSTDGTGDWLAREAARDPRIVPIRGPARGVAAARNAGIAAARGAVLAFLDADDQYLPEAIAERVALIERDPSVTLTFADVMSVDPEGRLVGYQFDYWPLFRAFLAGHRGLVPLGADAFAMLLAEMVCGTSSVVTRRSAVLAAGGFREDLKISEDWDLWLKLAQAGAVWCSTRRGTRYLVRPGSTSRHLEERVRSVQAVFAAHVSDIGALPQPWRGAAIGRMLNADAELARHEDRRLAALIANARAFGNAPGRRTAREMAFDLARLLRLK